MLPVEIVPIQESVVLRARGSELLILAHHVKELKSREKARDFSEYFRTEALVNRPARKLFEAWLRKDTTLWQRLYKTIHREMTLSEGGEAATDEAAPAPAKKPAKEKAEAAPSEEKAAKADKASADKPEKADKKADKKPEAAPKKAAAKDKDTTEAAPKKAAAKTTAKKADDDDDKADKKKTAKAAEPKTAKKATKDKDDKPAKSEAKAKPAAKAKKKG